MRAMRHITAFKGVRVEFNILSVHNAGFDVGEAGLASRLGSYVQHAGRNIRGKHMTVWADTTSCHELCPPPRQALDCPLGHRPSPASSPWRLRKFAAAPFVQRSTNPRSLCFPTFQV